MTAKTNAHAVALEGLWTPTAEELRRLVRYTVKGQPTYRPAAPGPEGRRLRIRLRGALLPAGELRPGRTYYVRASGEVLAQSGEVRRAVRVFPEPAGDPDALVHFDLDHMMRPVTAIEAMRAVRAGTRGGWPTFVRKSTVPGSFDRIELGEPDQDSGVVTLAQLHGDGCEVTEFGEVAPLCDWHDLDHPPVDSWRLERE